MNDEEKFALAYSATLKDLAEGRMAPEEWISWWKTNAQTIESACPRGWFLRLQVRLADSGVHQVAWASQTGACYVLEALRIPFVRSDRYQQAASEEFERFRAAQKAKNDLLIKQRAPILKAIGQTFPKFARFLKKRATDIDELEEPARELQIKAAEQALSCPLPHVYKAFLTCTRALSMDGFSIGLEDLFLHPAVPEGRELSNGSICVAEYWLEADGDQVVLPRDSTPDSDPPVYYYAHEARSSTARKLASSFSQWIESLPRSRVFRE